MAETQTQKARDNYDRYVYARDNGHIEYLKKAELCDRFFSGLQWDERVRKKLQRVNRPVMTINKVLSTVTTVMGQQLQNRADVAFRPAKDGVEEVATALTKAYMHITTNNSYETLESEMFDDGIITSRGFLDVRMRFDDHLKGEVGIELLNPHNVVIDPDASSYDPDGWNEVFITKWMSLEDIDATYGRAVATKLKNKVKSSFPTGQDSIYELRDNFGRYEGDQGFGHRPEKKRMYRIIERQYRINKNVPHFINDKGDMRPVPPTWSQGRIRKAQDLYGWRITMRETKRIHWRTSIDNIVVHDAISPYKHFTPVPYFPYFRRGMTMGLVEHLISPQEIFNKVVSQELHVLNSSANGGWKVKRGSLTNLDMDELEQRGAETGLVLELNEVGDAEKIQPNQVPTGLDRMAYNIDQYIKDVSNVSDSERGFDREDVAARAIEAKQAAGSVTTAKTFEALVRTRHLVAKRVLDLIQEYYTEERIIQITGDVPGAQTETFVVNQVQPDGSVVNDLTLGEYEVVVTSVPTRETFMESQFEEGLRLRELGIPIPDEHLIANSNLARKNEIIQSMQDSGAQQRAQMREELELADLEADVQKKQVDAGRSQAETQLAGARTQNTMADAQKTMVEMRGPEEEMALKAQEAQAQMMLDAQTAQGKLAMDAASTRAKIQQEALSNDAKLQLAREQMMAEMRLKEEQMRLDKQIEREKMLEELAIKRAEAAGRLAIMKKMEREKPKPKPAAGANK